MPVGPAATVRWLVDPGGPDLTEGGYGVWIAHLVSRRVYPDRELIVVKFDICVACSRRLAHDEEILSECLSLIRNVNVFDERLLRVHRSGLFIPGKKAPLDPLEVVRADFAWWRQPIRGELDYGQLVRAMQDAGYIDAS